MATTGSMMDALQRDAIPAIDTHCHPFPPAQDVIAAGWLRAEG